MLREEVNMTRHEAREVAFIIIFEKSFLDEVPVDEIIDSAAESEFFEVNHFVINTVKRVYSNLEEIDKVIDENLVGWSSKRISRVARAILRLAASELLFSDIPVGVSINEAVEIVKKYSVQEEASYVNGVLGSIAKKKNG